MTLEEILTREDALSPSEVVLVAEKAREKSQGIIDWLDDVALGGGTDTESKLAAIMIGLLARC